MTISILLVEHISEYIQMVEEATTLYEVGDNNIPFAVTTVASVDAAIEMLSSLAHQQLPLPRCILLNLNVLDTHSDDATMVAHLRKYAPHTPILILCIVQDEARAFEITQTSGSDYVLWEHLSPFRLVRSINRAIETQHMQQTLQTRNRQHQEYDERFYNIICQSSDAIVLVSKDGYMREVNPSAEHLLGRPCNELKGELFGFPIVVGEVTELDVFPKGQREPILTEMRLQEVEWNNEFVYLVSLRDVSDKARTTEALRRSQVTIFMIDQQGSFCYVDSVTESVTGYMREELLAMNMFDILEAEGLSVADLHKPDFQSDQSMFPHYQCRVVTRSGSVIWLDITLSWVIFKGRRALLGTGFNITHHKQIEEVLQESKDILHKAHDQLEERVLERTAELEQANCALQQEIAERVRVEKQLRLQARMLDTVGQAVIVTDTQGNIMYWNHAAEQLYGWSESEVLGENILVVTPSSQSREQATEVFSRLMQGESWSGEFLVQRRDGSRFPAFVTDVPFYNEQGELVGIIGVSTDITLQKQEKDQLRQARLVAETAARTKSEFLANMSHEMRTPLNAVIGMTNLLFDTSLSEEQRDFVETARTSGNALLSIINDVLDLSKIEADRLQLEQHPFELRTCIEESLDLVSAIAAQKRLTLAYMMNEDTPDIVMGDVTRLRQILVNLLSNAVKFTQKGDVVVFVSTEQRAKTNNHCTIHIAVQDSGIGISQDQTQYLFQSFSQIDASTSRKYGGTGLGLVISKRLAEMMGGTIWVESDTGKGATFHVTLKTQVVAQNGLFEDYPYKNPDQPLLQKKRLLIVSSSVINRRVLTYYAEFWGMVVQQVVSEDEALAVLKQQPYPDMALFDMYHADETYIALMQNIRKLPQGNTIPVLLLVFMGLDGDVQKSQKITFTPDAILTMPIKPSYLYNALHSILTGNQPKAVSPTTSLVIDPEIGKRYPLRLLLAEDNTINQKVALRILERMSYRADVAANGLEAIESMERQVYDVVLMDVQMPEMDGMEATKRIRERFPQEQQPYIIAMTAHVMEGDRERCLAVGMDDYVGKPIQIESLLGALERSRNTPKPIARAGTAQDAASLIKVEEVSVSNSTQRLDTSLSPVDESTYKQFLSLVCDDDADLARDFIQVYINDSEDNIVRLRQALEEHHMQNLTLVAHSQKSSSAQMGALQLSRLCAAMEQAVSWDDVPDLLEQIQAEYGCVRDWLLRDIKER